MPRTIVAMTDHTTHTPAGQGPHHLMLGTVTVSRLLGAAETDGQLSLIELQGMPGSGPGPHIDPWHETFYVLDGELTFRFERNGGVHTATVRPGDAFTIPPGIGHAFTVSGPATARYLILGTPAGIDAFFADGGDPIDAPTLPAEQPSGFDRDRLLRAFAIHHLTPYDFPA